MPREGVGVTLGAQVRHVVTYRGPPDGTLIYTVFTKKCQKRSKKGVPPVFDHFWEDSTYPGTPHPRMAPRRAKSPPRWDPRGAILSLREVFSRWGYQAGAIFKECPFGNPIARAYIHIPCQDKFHR